MSLQEFNPRDIVLGCNCIVVGKRESGKTALIMYLLTHSSSRVEPVTVYSWPTFESIERYREILTDDELSIDGIVRQVHGNVIVEADIEPFWTSLSYRSGLNYVLLQTNVRVFVALTSRFGFAPACRCDADYVFLLDLSGNHRDLYDDYRFWVGSSNAISYDKFTKLLHNNTQKYTALVLDLKCRESPPMWCRASPSQSYPLIGMRRFMRDRLLKHMWRKWKNCIADPSHPICRRRLEAEYNMLSETL